VGDLRALLAQPNDRGQLGLAGGVGETSIPVTAGSDRMPLRQGLPAIPSKKRGKRSIFRGWPWVAGCLLGAPAAFWRAWMRPCFVVGAWPSTSHRAFPPGRGPVRFVDPPNHLTAF